MKEWEAVAPEAEAPSPRLHAYDAMVLPLAALEPEPSKVTVNGAGPAAVEVATTAVGGVRTTGAVTVIAVEAELANPLLSVTVSVVVKVPAVVYEWEAVAPEAVEPSPKLQA